MKDVKRCGPSEVMRTGSDCKFGPGEVWPLNDAPLVWMVQEARCASL